jgi:hypothetical protein
MTVISLIKVIVATVNSHIFIEKEKALLLLYFNTSSDIFKGQVDEMEESR